MKRLVDKSYPLFCIRGSIGHFFIVSTFSFIKELQETLVNNFHIFWHLINSISIASRFFFSRKIKFGQPNYIYILIN